MGGIELILANFCAISCWSLLYPSDRLEIITHNLRAEFCNPMKIINRTRNFHRAG